MSDRKNDIDVSILFLSLFTRDQIDENLPMDVAHFLKKENIKMNLSKISDSEFRLFSPDKSIIIKFLIDPMAHKILYDIYLTLYNIHLKKQTLFDYDRLCSIIQKHRNQHVPTFIPDVMSVIDNVSLWARKNNYHTQWKELS